MKGKKKWKMLRRCLAGILGIGMVVGITVAGTLAYLYTLSEEKVNTFTGTNDIALFLDEPKYNLENGAVKWTEKLDPRQYIPGEVYEKDPTLYNVTGAQKLKVDGATDEFSEIWVAMRVDYTIAGTQVTHLQLTTDDTSSGHDGKGGLIEPIVFDAGSDKNWVKIETGMGADLTGLPTGAEIYVYRYPLKAKDGITKTALEGKSVDAMVTYQNGTSASVLGNLTEKTSPLFPQIQIKTLDQLKANGYEIENLVPFEIKVKGAAIKDMATIGLTEVTDAGLSTSDSGEQKLVAELVRLLK